MQLLFKQQYAVCPSFPFAAPVSIPVYRSHRWKKFFRTRCSVVAGTGLVPNRMITLLLWCKTEKKVKSKKYKQKKKNSKKQKLHKNERFKIQNYRSKMKSRRKVYCRIERHTQTSSFQSTEEQEAPPKNTQLQRKQERHGRVAVKPKEAKYSRSQLETSTPKPKAPEPRMERNRRKKENWPAEKRKRRKTKENRPEELKPLPSDNWRASSSADHRINNDPPVPVKKHRIAKNRLALRETATSHFTGSAPSLPRPLGQHISLRTADTSIAKNQEHARDSKVKNRKKSEGKEHIQKYSALIRLRANSLKRTNITSNPRRIVQSRRPWNRLPAYYVQK